MSQLSAVVGSSAHDSTGTTLGTVAQVYFDGHGEATRVSLRIGFFDATETYLPAHGATFIGNRLVLDVPTGQVDTAPVVGLHDHLDPAWPGAPLPSTPGPVP